MNIKNRALLFWTVCIPTRLLIARYADLIPYGSLVAAGIGGYWLMGSEQSDVGFFGGRATWKDLRPLHGALWIGYAATENRNFLYADAALGIAHMLTR